MDELDKTPQTKNQITDFTFGKMLFLGLITLFLCYSGPLSIFAPVPLAMAILLYGRARTTLMVLFGIGLLVALSFASTLGIFIGATFILAYLYSVLISEIIFRKINPSHGVMLTGFAVVIMVVLGIALTSLTAPRPLNEYVVDGVSKVMTELESQRSELMKAPTAEEAKMYREFLKMNPREVAQRIFEWTPWMVFVGIFLALWASLYMVLRNSVIWKQKISYPYSLRDIIEFKVPEFFVWPLIAGLALFLGGEYFLGEKAEVIAVNILYCLSIFYFFQGFGVLADFLTHIRIVGFFRSILMIITVFAVWRVLVIVGVFDMWINFRKYFKKKDNEGDML